MKRILLAILAIAALVAVFISPYNINNTLANYRQVNSAVAGYTFAQDNLKNTQVGVNSARDAFSSQRTFEVHFSDVSRIVQLLNGVATIQVSEVMCCDALNQFVPTVMWEEGMSPSAVRITLSVEDTIVALNVLAKMELPVYSVSTLEPGTVTIIFLTGGSL